MLRVGIVGSGLIGGKRAQSIASKELQDLAKVVTVTDLIPDRAEALAKSTSADVEPNWESLVLRKDIDAVVVATLNGVIPEIAQAALRSGKHVLLEKPAGRFPAEIAAIEKEAKNSGRTAAIGFNHRFHPGLLAAKEMVASGVHGPLMYIRARYGHGARLGYEKEWRGNPELSGGGELLDQGVHLIDLCRWIGGEFDLKWGQSSQFFWQMPVEDNGFCLLESPDKQRLAFLHASCTEWKNLFDFEIFCRDAKIEIWGLGRSYGVEELRVYKMKPEMGPPDVEITPFPGEDRSWILEFQAFLEKIHGRKSQIAEVSDARRAVEIVHGIYKMSGAAWARP